MANLGLIFSFVLNIIQAGLALHKQIADNRIENERISAKAKEQASAQKHEMDKLMFNEDAYISHQLLPNARKVCLDYILITKTELNESSEFPIKFSVEQQKAEANVVLYLPNALNEITSFQELNKSQTKHQNFRILNEYFDEEVIPALANELGSFQPRKR